MDTRDSRITDRARSKFLPAFLLIVLSLYFTGCANKGLRRYNEMKDPLSKGNYEEGLNRVQKNQDLYGEKDALLFEMDQGVLFFYLGQYDSSLAHFKNAEKIQDDLYARSVTDEATAIMTNDYSRPYRARPYERIALHQFMMMGYLAKGNAEGALVEVRKTQLLFDQLYRDDPDEFNDDGMFHFLASLAWLMDGEEDNAHISLFKSVRAYQTGKIPLPKVVAEFAWSELKRGGREDDIKKLGLSPPGNPEEQQQLAGGAEEIVLIGFTGRIPYLGEQRFSGTFVPGGFITVYAQDGKNRGERLVVGTPAVPAFARDSQGRTRAGISTHISLALPEVVDVNSRASSLRAVVNSQKKTTERITDYGKLLRQNMNDDKTAILARTALRVAIRTWGAQAGKHAMRTDSPVANLLISLTTDVATSQLEKADTRLCFWLPQTVEVARFPVSAGNHNLMLQVLGSGGEVLEQHSLTDISVKRGQKTFVFFPAVY